MKWVGDEDDVNAAGHDVDSQQWVLNEDFDEVGIAFRPRSAMVEDNFASVGIAEQRISRFSADFLRARNLMNKFHILVFKAFNNKTYENRQTMRCNTTNNYDRDGTKHKPSIVEALRYREHSSANKTFQDVIERAKCAANKIKLNCKHSMTKLTWVVL